MCCDDIEDTPQNWAEKRREYQRKLYLQAKEKKQEISKKQREQRKKQKAEDHQKRIQEKNSKLWDSLKFASDMKDRQAPSKDLPSNPFDSNDI